MNYMKLINSLSVKSSAVRLLTVTDHVERKGMVNF